MFAGDKTGRVVNVFGLNDDEDDDDTSLSNET